MTTKSASSGARTMSQSGITAPTGIPPLSITPRIVLGIVLLRSVKRRTMILLRAQERQLWQRRSSRFALQREELESWSTVHRNLGRAYLNELVYFLNRSPKIKLEPTLALTTNIRYNGIKHHMTQILPQAC